MFDILVNIDEMRDDAMAVQMGLALAARHGAFATGLRIVDAYALAISIPGGVAVLDAEEREAKAQDAWWLELCRRHGVAGAWEVIRGIYVPVLARRSCMADLTISSAPAGADDFMVGMDGITRVLLGGASPMLLVPPAWKGSRSLGRILVAWNSTVGSMRALRAALPFLREAEQVCVVDGSRDEVPGLAPPPLPLADWLLRRGVRRHAIKPLAASSHVGEALLDEADRMDADLLVMGAWGHSRIGEWVLGGATRHVLRKAALPVLLAH